MFDVFVDLCVCVFQFVEKRREMKADGRTDKELEESYCFLLADAVKVSCPLETEAVTRVSELYSCLLMLFRCL